MANIVVFNPGETSWPVDGEGHQVEPHSWASADEDYVGVYLAAGILTEEDVSEVDADSGSSQAVIMAKKDMEQSNAEADVAEVPAVPAPETPEVIEAPPEVEPIPAPETPESEPVTPGE